MIGDTEKTILIIDDDLTIRKLIGHHLKNNSYYVLEAEGPEQGFNYLGSNDIDLVLCDVTMEFMDGFTFCRKVREQEKYRMLPFIFVTAKNSMEDKSKAMEVGGDDIITKPFDINELLLKVQTLIRRSDIYKTYGAKKILEKSFKETTAKVLLVDDDIALSKLFQFNLSKAGFDCETTTSAEEAMKLAKANHHDIIISDIIMPDIDGFHFRKMILNDPDLKSIPFIFLSAKGEEDDILGGYDLGIADYVVKTAGPKVVVAKVKAIIKSLGKERQKVVSELHNAADSLHAKFVPDKKPQFDGFEIDHWHQPFEGIPGGDFIDYFHLDEDNYAIILGDVMGKKWGAWYFTFAYAGYVRSISRVVLQNATEYNPSDLMQQVNKSVYKDAKVSEVFATLSIIILNRKNRTLKYTGAGDLPIIYKNNLSGEIKKIRANGMLLGFAEDGNYEDSSIEMQKNDLVFIVTDGIIESRNSNNEQFGKEKLIQVINELDSKDNPIGRIKNSFEEFTSGKFEDDISLISIKA